MNERHSNRPQRGRFSLVELMVAVALLGIAASITIPIYMGDVFAERQQECPTELEKIVAAETAYFKTHHRYTPDLSLLDWQAPAQNRYRYGFRSFARGQVVSQTHPYLTAEDLPHTFIEPSGFQIGCVGNVDTDSKLDRFTMGSSGTLVHVFNDIE